MWKTFTKWLKFLWHEDKRFCVNSLSKNAKLNTLACCVFLCCVDTKSNADICVITWFQSNCHITLSNLLRHLKKTNVLAIQTRTRHQAGDGLVFMVAAFSLCLKSIFQTYIIFQESATIYFIYYIIFIYPPFSWQLLATATDWEVEVSSILPLMAKEFVAFASSPCCCFLRRFHFHE